MAGALSLGDAAAVICRRSLLLRRISGQGEMALVELTVPEAEAALVGYEQRLSVAVSNSPRSTVLSGDPAALAEVLSALEARGVFCRRVKVDVASHSPQVDPLRGDLIAALAALAPRAAAVPMRSTVTGAALAGPELVAGYWADNLRQPVRFAGAVEALLGEGYGLFVEVSPHPVLTPAIEEMRAAAASRGAAVGSTRREQPERRTLLEALGGLWAQGATVAWDRLFAATARRVPLPSYPWQRERYWLDAPAFGSHIVRDRAPAGAHPLLGQGQSVSIQAAVRLWETTLDRERLPWIADHAVAGVVVWPGAGYLEMALAAGAEALGGAPVTVTDVAFVEALVLRETAARVQISTLEERPGHLRFQIASQPPGNGQAAWTVHARGTLRRAESDEAPGRLDLGALRARLSRVAGAEVYTALAAMGLDYGPAFQGILELWQGDGEALGRVRLPEAAGPATAYRIHPALLDACFQVMAARLGEGGEGPWVPVELGSLRLSSRPAGELWCHARLAEDGPEHRRSIELRVTGGDGATVLEVSGLVARRLAGETRRREQDDWFFEVTWEPAAAPTPRLRSGRFVLLGHGAGRGAALAEALRAAGHTVVHAVAGAPAAAGSALAPFDDRSAVGVGALLHAAFGGQTPTAVVHLGSLDGDDEPSALDGEAIEAALSRGPDSVLATVQALSEMACRDAPRLWLVTRGAQPAGGGAMAVAQSPLVGLGRVIAMEHPELRCALVDLDPAGSTREVERLLAEITADGDDQEIAWRGSERRVARLVRRLPEAGRGMSALPSPPIRGDGTYLVTGGLGGLGLRVAGWLAERGAGHLVLVGRSGAASAAQRAAVAALAAGGTRVTVAAVDVADHGQVASLLADITTSGLPLRGVIHAAGVLDDGLLLQQTPARLRAVMAPKILGALHLHELTRATPLDFFVLYASGAGILGSPGQGNYASANTFLDALAHHRKALGLPGLSIDWGAFSEVGLAAAQDNRGARLSGRGLRSMTPEEGLSAFERLLASDRAQAVVTPFDARQWVELYPAAASPMLSPLLAGPSGAAERTRAEAGLVDRLAGAEPAARARLLRGFVRAEAARVLRTPEDRLDVNALLTTLGMDSLMSLELRNRVEAALGIRLPATLLWMYPTVTALSVHLDAVISAAPEIAAPTPAAPALPVPGAGAPPEPSDEDLMDALRAEL